MSNKKMRTLLIFNYPHAASTSELRLQLEPLGCCVGEIERVSLSNQQQTNQSTDSTVRVSVRDDQVVEQLIRRELVVAVRGIQLFFFADDILQGEKALQSSVLGFLNEKIPAFDVESLAPPGVVCSTYPWEFGGGSGGGYIFRGPTAQLQIVEERLLQCLIQATAPKHSPGGISATDRPPQVVSSPVRPLMASTPVCQMASPPTAPVMSPSARPVMPRNQVTPEKLLQSLREANKRSEEFGSSLKHQSGLSQAPFYGRQQSFSISHHSARGTGTTFTASLPFKPYAADSFTWDNTAAGDQDAGFSRQLQSSASSKVAAASSGTLPNYYGMRCASSRKNSNALALGGEADAADKGSTILAAASEQNSRCSVAGSEIVQDTTSGSQRVFGALELKLSDVPTAVEPENVGLAAQSKGNQRARKANPQNRSLAQHQMDAINQWMAKVPHGLSGYNHSELPEDNSGSFAAAAAGIASRQRGENANVSGPSALLKDAAVGGGARQSALACDDSEPVREEEGLEPDYEFEGGDADDFKEASSDWQDLVGKDFCQVCKCKLTGSMNEQTAQAHCKGAKHKKKFRRQQSDDFKEA